MKNNVHITHFMNFYKDISKSKNDEIKCYFLFNLPAMNKLIDKNIYTTFKSTYLDLARNKNDTIRFYWISILEDLLEFIPEEDRLGPIKQILEYYFETEITSDGIEAILKKLNVIFKYIYSPEEDALIKASLLPKPVKVRNV